MLRFEALQTPPDDGDTLIEPEASRWQALMEDYARRLARQTPTLAGVPVEAARRDLRSRRLGLDAEARVMATGHQPAFVHAGVWAKRVVARHVAAAIGAAAIDLVVDSDAPDSWALCVPVVGRDGSLTTRQVVFAAAPAGSAYEGRPPLEDQALAAIGSELSAALGERFAGSLMPTYLGGLAARADAPDAVQQHLAGRSAVDASLAADLPDRRVSKLFGGPFVADLLLNAPAFAAAYNDALADYRREHKVRDADRPVPDLGLDGDRVETPLWIYKPLHGRRRLWVRRRTDRIDLCAERIPAGAVSVGAMARDADGTLASLHPWVIRPRALTLTLWARLLVCDLFVHGIGGAKYDRITDGVFRRYYRCEPPPYACVSATLRLPLPRRPVTRHDLATARLQVRDWRYNPDRYLSDPPANLLAQRSRLIQESNRLRETHASRIVRREVFLGIRGANAELTEAHPDVGRALTERLADLRLKAAGNRVADSREYFYALQPSDRLAMLVDRLTGEGRRHRP